MQDWLRLRPTPDQYREFAEYLCAAHSWYKHLPLMGRRFVVFLAPDSGIGSLIAVLHDSNPETVTGYSLVTPAEGPEFTDANPRLHYGWKTTKEYRTRFGYLDYSCWEKDGAFARDVGSAVTLPARLVEQCQFVLYPYVSPRFAQVQAWSVHAESLAVLRSGAAHPAREEIIELAQLSETENLTWNALSDAEREWIIARDGERSTPLCVEPSDALSQYIALDDRFTAIADSLQKKEAAKVERALIALDRWLLQEADAQV